MKTSVRILQALMWFVCAFHVGVGLALNLAPGSVDVIAKLYGAKVDQWSPQFLYMMYPLGAFMLALGVVAALTARDPVRFRPVIYIFAGLFTIRALHRVFLGSTTTEVFGISPDRVMGNMVFFFALAGVLIIADLAANRATGSAK